MRASATPARPSEGASEADAHFGNAAQVLVGGASGSARINAALGRPMLAASGDGAWFSAPDGRRYLDLWCAYGATVLGHNHPAVRRAIEAALDTGVIHGPETPHQARLAARLVDLVPSAELVRFANSGTEATLAAIRLARTHTGRTKILKFEGHFHGIHDHVLFSAHPGPREPAPGRLLEPEIDSGGVPAALAGATLVAPWNDLAAVERAFAEHGDDLAAVIMEPINYNSGSMLADREYLRAVREITRDRGTVLIFDEVLSGFRTGLDCAQGFYGVTPDVTLLGKAIANGVPIAVIAGRREVMERFSPLGSAAHSGTYSGHIFGVLAALATLDVLAAPGWFDGPDGVFAIGERLGGGMREIFARHGVACRVQGIGTRFGLMFGSDPDRPISDYQEVARHDSSMLTRFVRACFEREVYFHAYDVVVGHHGFGSAHGWSEVETALDRMDAATATLV